MIADDIQAGDDNRTRFAVIARPETQPRRHRGGAARRDRRPAPDDARVRRPQRARARSTARSGAFASRGLNLSRLESRPWTERGARWEYLFWVDLDADPADPACAAALADLGAETELVRILGTYPRAAED